MKRLRTKFFKVIGIFLVGLLGGIIGSLTVIKMNPSPFFRRTLNLGQIPSIADAEQLTLTTYYPSPYGVYDGLVAYRLGIGDTNSSGGINNADAPATQGDLLVANRLGIGVSPTDTWVSATNDRLWLRAGQIRFPDNSVMDSSNVGSADSVSNNGDAVIQADADSNGSGQILLRTGAADRMVVTNAGNVQISTAVDAPLISSVSNPNVSNNASAQQVVRADTANLFMETTSSAYTIGTPNLASLTSATNAECRLWNLANTPMTFYTNNTERARIEADGSVDIGTQGLTINNDEILNVNGVITFVGTAAAPTTPDAGYGKLYVRGDRLYYMNNSGTEFDLVYGYYAPPP